MKIVFKHILRNIWSKKGRSFLIVLALTVATTVFTLNLTLPDELVLKIQQTLRSVYGDVDIAMGTVEEFSINDIELGDEEIRVTKSMNLEGLYNDKPIAIQGLNIEEAKNFRMLNDDVPNLSGNQVVISERQAEEHGFNEGQKLKVTFEDKEYVFEIVKIVENKGLNSLTVEYPQFICNIEEAAKIRELSSDMTDAIFIDVIEEGKNSDYADFLGEHNDNYMVEMLADEESIKESCEFVSYLLLMIFVMATIMIMFVVSSLNKIIIAERMPVIGTFRSIGATRGKMNGILILENAVYGLIGGLIGGLLGYKLNSNVAGLFVTTNGVELTKDTSKINGVMILIGVTFAVLLQVIITAKAIIKANKKPVKDLIFDVHSSRYRVLKHRNVIGAVLIIASLVTNYVLKDINILVTILAIVMLITGVAMVVPYLLQMITKVFAFVFRKLGFQSAFMASKNIGYNKMIVTSSRVVVVAVSLMLAIVTVSTSVTNLFQSFRLMVDDYDIVLSYVSKEEKDYEKLLEIEDVTHIEYLHAYWDEATYNDGKEFNVSPSIIGMKESRKYIDELNYKISDLKENEVLIDEVYAEKNNLKIGDSLKIKFATLNKEFEYIIRGTVNSTYFTTSRNVIILNYDYYIENISKIPMQVQLKVEDGTDLEKIKKDVKDTMKELDLKIQTVDEYITDQEESVAGIMSIFYVIIGLAVVLSFIGIINNQVISFIQRRKEIAVLNSTCMSKGQLKKMLFFETLLANFIAAAIAIVTSILATDMIDNFMKGMAMYVQVEYSLKTALVFTGVIIAVLVFTLISPLRRLKKINIVNEIKYE